MNISTPTDVSPYVSTYMTDNQYLEKIYMLLVVITVVIFASFVHNMLRGSFRKIRGDIDHEK